MRRFNDILIADMIRTLVGAIEPVGDSSLDDEIYMNQLNMQGVIDVLLDDVQHLLSNKKSYEYSVKRAGEEARNWLEEKRDWLNELLAED
jgi:hypothetical protein